MNHWAGKLWYAYGTSMTSVQHGKYVPIINVFCESGYARVKNRDYQWDNIHLNELGGVNMGHFVWNKLKDIPLWQTE